MVATEPAPVADRTPAMQQIRGNQIITIVLALAVFAGAFGIGLAGIMAVGAVIGGGNESAASSASTPSPTIDPDATEPIPTYQSACSMFSSCYNIPSQPIITPQPSATPATDRVSVRIEECPVTAGFTIGNGC